MSLILSGTDGLSDIDGSAATPAIRGTDANTGIFFPAADTIAFSEGGAEVMRIDSAGNVGIGNTPSGTYKLEVSGLISGSGFSAVGNTTLNRATATAYNVAGGVQFQVDGTSYSAIAQPAAQVLAFYTGNATTERMRINSSGNVGIGTASPAVKLEVQADLSANTEIARFSHSTGDTGRGAKISLGVSGYPMAQLEGFADSAGNGSLRFYTYTSTTTTEKMRIDSSGNLLLATTTASGKIATFVGSGQVGYYTNKSSGGGGLDHAQYYTDGGLQGKITQTGGFTTVSDYRIKSAVTPLSGMLEKVCKLKPVSYTLTAFGQQQYGFIAHELQEELPVFVDGEKDAVNEDGSIAPQSVDYPKIVSVLTAAIQEQQALILSLTTRLTALEQK
jgi:hypothetical protein